MIATASIVVVPLLALVVLSMLLVTTVRSSRCFGLGAAGVMGVILAGPGAMLLLGAETSEAAARDGSLKLKPVIDVGAGSTEPESAAQSPDSARPGWVTAEPVRDAEVHTIVVSSGPHVHIEDCPQALDRQIKAATDEYIQRYIGHEAAPRILDLDLKYINKHVRTPGRFYHEQRDSAVGPMQTSYAQLEFDEEFRHEINRRWQDEVAKSRLLFTGLLGGGILALLVTVFGYFRLDNATRGFYTGRLQFVAIAAVLALVAAGVLAVKWTGVNWLW